MTETKPNPDPRAEYIRGLREIADWLEAHPEVPLPYLGTTQGGRSESGLHIYLGSDRDQKAELAKIARAMGKAEKVPHDDLGRLNLVRRFAGIALIAVADRDEVCEKVVLSTETVTEMVPDPEYMAIAPMIQRETVKEIVEWRCTSILAGAAS